MIILGDGFKATGFGSLGSITNADVIIKNSTPTRAQVNFNLKNLDYGNAKFIKYCENDYRIDKTQTIRIQTLEDYQIIESKARVDPNEIINDGFSSKGRISRKLFPSELNQKLGRDVFVQNENKKTLPLTLNNSRIYLQNKQQLPNCYVFCCSASPASPVKQNLLEKFGGSYYEIIDIQNFKNLLHTELKNKIKLKGGLEAVFQKVEYVKKKTSDIDNSQIDSKGYVMKNDDFDDEYEYRIIFALLDEEKNVIPVPIGYVDIPNNDHLKNCCNVP